MQATAGAGSTRDASSAGVDRARPWVAYVGPFPYPSGGAASRRVLGVAESLALAGFDVVIASGAGQSGTVGPPIRQASGISYRLLPERSAEHWPRPLRRLRYARMGKCTLRWLAEQPVAPVAVVLYSGYTPYLQRLLPWCREHGVRLLFDAVEWYEPAQPFGYLVSPYQWNIEWAMRRLVPRADGVIAISRYLANYYSARGLPVAIVPPTTSTIAPGEWVPASGVRLCYAGNPGNKDELRDTLRAVARLVSTGAPITFTVAGPPRSVLLDMLGASPDRNLEWLRARGMLDHAQVTELVGASDYSILARRRCRVSEAGFPTKFVESFAVGTPVIANLTGDLHLHLRDRETGLVCPGPDEASIASTVIRALELGEDRLREMRRACLREAQAAFHPSHYARALRDLVTGHGDADDARLRRQYEEIR